ncbi:unnamed protein product [Thlaspi arvense]|uniref:GAGA-binding transcriptional activator n=1 Tax=Thlaspi arvense TaxID=13288 RepID=A0AAU9RF60_THLAR|nr:unnamed protein product [Thlaspi arvense]
MTEPVNHTNSETKPTKSKKKKSTAKQSKKKPSASRHPGIKVERKNQNVFFNEAKLDLSAVPPPYCSCTGVARICYKNGPGGWQSSCCTTKISEYPLPMSSLRPGARVGGRKMTRGAYTNLLYRLVSEGHDISYPVDLKDHWARLGSNKFVTIKYV